MNLEQREMVLEEIMNKFIISFQTVSLYVNQSLHPIIDQI
jgi:hypothetical protein